MNICVWRTGHEIADTVAESVRLGFFPYDDCFVQVLPTLDYCTPEDAAEYDIHIGYGILRGMDNVFRACQKAGKPFFHIDKGYWKPGHYDGYYRISLNGTQQTTGLDKLEPDYARWDALGIEIFNRPYHDSNCEVMMCPPTDHVANFFGVDSMEWAEAVRPKTGTWFFREKGCDRNLDKDFDECQEVITFNSSVGWEALRQGIPVVSDAEHSIVGSWQKLVDKSIHDDLEARRKLLAIQASLQLTLTEIKSGLLWPLIQRLLIATSATTAEKQ